MDHPGPVPRGPGALWRHAYGEAGRIMRRDFWVPDMSGVDWDGVLREYRPLLDRIRTAAEFADLLWEVLGELGTSHAYAVTAGAPRGRVPAGQTRCRPSRDADGAWRWTGCFPGNRRTRWPARRWRPPAPGWARRRAGGGGRAAGGPGARSRAAAGRCGREAGRADGAPSRTRFFFFFFFFGSVSEPQVRRVVVVPLRTDRRLRYQDWVAGRRRQVASSATAASATCTSRT